ncbi:hypothetical protein B0H15DRAFT_936765 [Mycena belliarum]|uniref:Transmembrane protein n=1 Tax=Mycena belliarum TaxID=1033014 RepID=A0AAD6UEU2_9AGAR|nr:hypothetical protein B0H15DRAFT_936765 [Mycena belliae]
MPDWASQKELILDATVFLKFMHSLLGVYAWEWFISLPFDWEVLTGKKAFRWPLIFYFLNRYLLLAAMAGIAVALDSTTEIDCQAVYTFNQFAGNAAVGLASINLSLRTLAIWSQNKWIKLFLIVVILGHWSLILQGVLLKANWDPQLNACNITGTNNTVLAATFTYSMCFDLVVFLLNAYKLGSKRKSGSRLMKMIFKDGLIFFFIAFLANLIATVFMIMNLNSIMNVIFNVPAAIASTIVATRAVRHLTNFTSKGPEMYAPSGSTSASNFRSASGGPRGITASGRGGAQPGVHVQMETFVLQDSTHADPEYGPDLSLKRQSYDAENKAPTI